MTKDEKSRIELLQAMGLYDPNNKFTSLINVKALKDFTNEQIFEAAGAHAQNSSYPLKVFDICEYWRKKNGNSETDIKAGLALKAEQVFNELLSKANSANDWIVADARAAVTIKALYVSPQRFSRSDKDADDWTRKNFIARYQAVTDAEIAQAQCLFGGYYANTYDPRVTFLGDYQQCLQLASQVYTDKKPRLPNDPNVPKLPVIHQDCECTSQEISKRYISTISELLEKAVKKPNGTGVKHEICL